MDINSCNKCGCRYTWICSPVSLNLFIGILQFVHRYPSPWLLISLNLLTGISEFVHCTSQFIQWYPFFLFTSISLLFTTIPQFVPSMHIIILFLSTVLINLFTVIPEFFSQKLLTLFYWYPSLCSQVSLNLYTCFLRESEQIGRCWWTNCGILREQIEINQSTNSGILEANSGHYWWTNLDY